MQSYAVSFLLTGAMTMFSCPVSVTKLLQIAAFTCPGEQVNKQKCLKAQGKLVYNILIKEVRENHVSLLNTEFGTQSKSLCEINIQANINFFYNVKDIPAEKLHLRAKKKNLAIC